MKQPWRNLALLLFAAAVVVGGLAGHNLLAIDADQVAQVRLYTELIEAAHANYAVDDVTYRDLVYASIGGMLRNLDPHTNFLPPVAYDTMRERQQSSFYGLGIYVGTRNNRLTVISPIEGTPGYEKGIRAGDIIHLINGEPTEEMNPNEAIRKLKGPKGTDVTVTLLRPGLDEPLVETRGRIDSSHQSYRSTGRHEPLGLPIVVLVNGSSASASEIVSGAIQDHDVGLVVGESTWGKGLVQTVYELSYGAGLALTTARYYTPAGRLIQRDYSSYWDYYTGYDANGDNGDSEEGELPPLDPGEKDERPVFHTDLGREVYGGGGVTPDYVVELEDDPPVILRLRTRSGFHRFPFEEGVPEGVDSTDWQVPDDYLERFWKWIVEEDLVTAEELEEAFEDPAVERHARVRLRYEIFNTAFGLTEGFKAERQLDNQLARALELLGEAEELLERRMEQDGQTRGRNRPSGLVAGTRVF